MAKHHLIISGTGRAGTTLLIQLLTELGLDTGFASLSDSMFPGANAGLERDMFQPNLPYIVKSPHYCDHLDALLQQGGTIIDHAIVPIRDLYSAAQSRREVQRQADPPLFPQPTPGGLWDTPNPELQEWVLARKFHLFLHTLAVHDIPLTLLDFPRFAYEPEYLYRKIQFALGDIGYEQFLAAFGAVNRPELIHNFQASQQ